MNELRTSAIKALKSMLREHLSDEELEKTGILDVTLGAWIVESDDEITYKKVTAELIPLTDDTWVVEEVHHYE